MALFQAMQFSQVKCLISIQSENPESYMFHTPNIHLVEKQAEAIGIPIIIQQTKGVKEEELVDLKHAITKAMQEYHIEGVVTGAIESVYQASRIQKICDELKIECFNPLWQKDQFAILHDLVLLGFDVIIIGVFAEGMELFLGKKIDEKFIDAMHIAHAKYLIHVGGEGGEYESFVLNAPFFRKKLVIKKSHIENRGNGAKVLVIDELE